MYFFAKVDEAGNVLEFPSQQVKPVHERRYFHKGILPDEHVVVDHNTNMPESDWTKKYSFGEVLREDNNYIATYVEENRFATTEEASDYLKSIIPNYRKMNEEEFQRRVNLLVLNYSQREIESWDQQVREAKLFVQEQVTTNTPLIESMATTRGIDAATLCAKILQKADAFAKAYGQLLGNKQKNEDILDTLEADTTDTTNWPMLNTYGW